MGWEYRAGGGPYYIRYTRRHGREVREYFGRGPEAEKAAAEDARKLAERERERIEQRQLQALDSQTAELTKVTKTLVHATLLGAGFHQHSRQWRKSRQLTKLIQKGNSENMLTTTSLMKLTETISLDDLKDLIERGMQGDQEVLPMIRQVLDQCPELWQEAGNHVSRAENTWLQAMAGNDLITQEILSRQHNTIKTELLAATSTPVERLLVETLGVHRLQFMDASCRVARNVNQSGYVADYQEKRLANASRQLEQAGKSLAQIQRLLRPKAPVINIAEQQIVNVA